jgi:hypothetical protein
MSFIQHLQSFGQRTTVAVVIFTSVSFHGCTASGRSCAVPATEAASAITKATETDRLSDSNSVIRTDNESGFAGGPMNESASLPIHMTE